MNHTPELRKAIQFAARKHHGHMRKETEPLPYVTHLFSAALLVGEAEADEEVVIAALLHDTIEDTGTTKEEIEASFGSRVADIVQTVSEPKEFEGRTLDWKEMKKMYLAQIELGSDDALVVSIADKIDNIETKLDSYAKEGAALLERWARPTADYVWYHGAVLHIAEARLPKHPLTKRLRGVHDQEIKAFAYATKSWRGP